MFHRVSDGECLSSIARYFRRDTRALAKFNDLRPPYVIHKNTHLYIPPLGGESFLRVYRISLGDIRAARARLDRGWDGKTSLWKKASPARFAAPAPPKKRRVIVSKPAAPVPLKKARLMKTRVLASASKKTPAKSKAAPRRASTTKRTVAKAAVPKVSKRSIPSSRSKAAPKRSSSKSKRNFMWPLDRYSLLSSFSSNWYDNNFGMDLRAKQSAPIHAIEDGKVLSSISSEAELRKLGTSLLGHLIVVDHGGGFTSLYAGTSKNLVRSGQTVKRGQTIGLVGSTGKTAEGFHLHLQIRYNGEARDPEKYLPKKSLSGALLASKRK